MVAQKGRTIVIPFRALRRFRDAIDDAAKIRGWTRTTWILYWLGKGLDHDRDLFSIDDAEVERRRAHAKMMNDAKTKT